MSGWIQATMQQNTIITGQEEKETLFLRVLFFDKSILASCKHLLLGVCSIFGHLLNRSGRLVEFELGCILYNDQWVSHPLAICS